MFLLILPLPFFPFPFPLPLPLLSVGGIVIVVAAIPFLRRCRFLRRFGRRCPFHRPCHHFTAQMAPLIFFLFHAVLRNVFFPGKKGSPTTPTTQIIVEVVVVVVVVVSAVVVVAVVRSSCGCSRGSEIGVRSDETTVF